MSSIKLKNNTSGLEYDVQINSVALDAVTGTNTGDEDVTSIKTKLGITVLSGSNTGDEDVTSIKTKLGITTLSGSNTGDQDLTPYLTKTALTREVVSGDITIGTGDNGYVVTYTGAGAVNVVLPVVSGFSSDFQCQVWNQSSAAVNITFTAQAGEFKGSANNLAQYKTAMVLVRNSKWWVAGGLG